jgi:hypothetical protein
LTRTKPKISCSALFKLKKIKIQSYSYNLSIAMASEN